MVLLIVLNWFVHKVYWSEWIGRHHRQRRKLLARTGIGATLGLVALGFTSVYREGFEVVLFLQNLELQAGTATVLEGVAIGLAAHGRRRRAHVLAAPRLPYKRMLVLTGVLVGVVLVVMIGGTALTFQDLGWLPRHATPFTVPEWMGAWFEMYSTWETLGRAGARRAVRGRLLPARRAGQGDAGPRAAASSRRCAPTRRRRPASASSAGRRRRARRC